MATHRKPGLTEYRRKRRFLGTPEPATTSRKRQPLEVSNPARKFVVHLHHSRRRHFDLRLQVGHVLKSWAVPKGPSLDPSIKRLAIEVEDHPVSYAEFEGTIPEGHYGAGDVAVWDEGSWRTAEPIEAQFKNGHLRFELDGTRLHGAWSLIRTRPRARQKQWLLLKGDDEFATADDVADDMRLSERRAGSRAPRKATTARQRTSKQSASTSKRKRGGPPAATHFELELARLHRNAPTGDDWLHEMKYDGYRMLAWRNGNDVRLSSRNRLDWTPKLPTLVHAVAALKCRACVLDGELVVFDDNGHSRFDLLQREFDRKQSEVVRYVIFDLLWLDGSDLRTAPQHERKEALAQLLKAKDDALVYSDFMRGHGALAYRRACEEGLEGIISKSAEASYRGGRGDDWRKLKCVDSDEFVIVGYTPGKGSRGALGALLLAEPQGARWHYAGRVGTGMDEATLKRLRQRLKPARIAPDLVNPPNTKQLRGAKPVWVRPLAVAEILFRGRTGDDLLRQASFKGLRADKSPEDLNDREHRGGERSMPRQVSKSSAPKVSFTHPDRILIRKPKVTKRDLADFYAQVADHLLPGIVGRPLSLLRCPEGISDECFFQKHPMAGMPESIQVDDARKSRGKQSRFMFVDNVEGVRGLVQMNVIEFHPWGSTINDLEHPDRLVFDLDPDTGVAWPQVRAAARLLRERLQAVGLESFLRTTGGKGLHVVVPLDPRPDWTSAKAFSHALARTLERESPKEYVSVASKTRRKGRIFIDYLRNARGSTAVASYCVRARPGAGVATPLRWDELARLRSGAQYTITNIKRRLSSIKQDPWQGFDQVHQGLPKM